MENTSLFFAISDSCSLAFEHSAFNLLKRLASNLEVFVQIVNLVDDYECFEMDGLNSIFEQKLATYIGLKLNPKQQYCDNFIIRDQDILKEITNIINLVLDEYRFNFYRIDDIANMLNEYPINLLMVICKTEYNKAYLIGESVKRFIAVREILNNWIPVELYDVIESNMPLIGHEKSPLTELELYALYRYLGSRKNIYVNILLNSLFELEKCNKFITAPIMNEEMICTVCKSSWFFLFLFASIQYHPYSDECDENVLAQPISTITPENFMEPTIK